MRLGLKPQSSDLGISPLPPSSVPPGTCSSERVWLTRPPEAAELWEAGTKKQPQLES